MPPDNGSIQFTINSSFFSGMKGIKGKLAGKMQKLQKAGGGGVSAQNSVQSTSSKSKPTALQTATTMMGLFLKTHKKRTEEEIMAAFGTELDDDSEMDDFKLQVNPDFKSNSFLKNHDFSIQILDAIFKG